VKNTTSKIDRATLLKSGGLAALGFVLAGASPRPRKGQCCDPIDLTYEIGTGARKKKRSSAGCQQLNAIRLVTRTSNQPTQPPISGWQSSGLIPAAQIVGDDGLGGKGLKHATGYDIWVYTQ
jgi:hypothetical protein